MRIENNFKCSSRVVSATEANSFTVIKKWQLRIIRDVTVASEFHSQRLYVGHVGESLFPCRNAQPRGVFNKPLNRLNFVCLDIVLLIGASGALCSERLPRR